MITLASGRAQAVISPEGAWVEELSDASGKILFSKASLANENGEVKTRGGMHVCLPNFGPGGGSGLAQHGFGRSSTWSVVERHESSVSLRLQGPEPQYANLVTTVVYELSENTLSARLVFENTGQSSVRLAPGFHPYLALDESETSVKVNDIPYNLDTLVGTEFITADTAVLKTATRTITLSQENLSTWAIWTDLLDHYVCVEPTYGGYRFLEEPNAEELLAPGDNRVFSCTLSWQIN